MGLKAFNMSNIKHKGDRRGSCATVGVNGKSGLIGFSAHAVRVMGLKAGKGVCFFQDEETGVDWFVKRSEAADAIVLRGNEDSGMLYFNSSVLAQIILGAVQGREKYAFCSFPIQEKAVEVKGDGGYYLIITAKPVRVRARKD
jgi:hypothetical protein